MSQIPFSIVMAVYDKEHADFFDRALQSIMEDQSVKPSEIILVCDGKLSDELNGVIEKYQSQYSIFNVIRLPDNRGLGNALRIAVECASNELIARMDSDDVSIPDRFEQQLYYFQRHPEIDIVGGDITEFIEKEENIIGKRSVPTTDAKIKEYMKKRCAMNHVSVMYKKAAVQAAGGYQDWFWNEDYYLWIRMWLNGAVFANTGTVLVNVRVGEKMYQRRGGIKYFKSEFGIQTLMYKSGIISEIEYAFNVFVRFIVQMLMPNQVRGWFFRIIARGKGQ